MKKEQTDSIDKSLEEALLPLQQALAGETLESGESQELDSVDQDSNSEESSETETDVKETDSDVDDSGVPYKNRFMEVTRKLSKIEEELQSLKSQGATASKDDMEELAIDKLRSMPVVPATQGQAQSSSNFHNEDDSTQRPVTREEVFAIQQALAAKAALDTEAFKRFPELNDQKSLLFKETQARIEARKARGVPINDPALVLEAAEAAFGRLVAIGKINPTTRVVAEEKTRRTSVDSTVIPVSKKSTTVSSSSGKKALTRTDEAVLKQFNRLGVKMTPEEFLKRKR